MLNKFSLHFAFLAVEVCLRKMNYYKHSYGDVARILCIHLSRFIWSPTFFHHGCVPCSIGMNLKKTSLPCTLKESLSLKTLLCSVFLFPLRIKLSQGKYLYDSTLCVAHLSPYFLPEFLMMRQVPCIEVYQTNLWYIIYYDAICCCHKLSTISVASNLAVPS